MDTEVLMLTMMIGADPEGCSGYGKAFSRVVNGLRSTSTSVCGPALEGPLRRRNKRSPIQEASACVQSIGDGVTSDDNAKQRHFSADTLGNWVATVRKQRTIDGKW